MSRPFSPQEVEERIAETVDRLEDHVTDMPKLADEAADAKFDYEVAFAKALLAARHDEQAKSAPEREALATVACEKELRRKLRAETTYDTHRRVIAVLQAQGDLLRTMSASRRSVGDERR